MISAKLIHRIEDHWELISGKFYRELRTNPDLPHIARMPESELSEACRRVLRNLGEWLGSGGDSEIAWYYEKIGADRHRQSIPLSQAIRTLQLMKDATISFIREDSSFESTVDVYSQEELEHRLGRFFDLLVFHLARGYEDAATKPHHHSTAV